MKERLNKFAADSGCVPNHKVNKYMLMLNYLSAVDRLRKYIGFHGDWTSFLRVYFVESRVTTSCMG